MHALSEAIPEAVPRVACFRAASHAVSRIRNSSTPELEGTAERVAEELIEVREHLGVAGVAASPNASTCLASGTRFRNLGCIGVYL